MNNEINWSPDMLLCVELVGDVFLRVKETLERIGVANFEKKILQQTCYILHKRGEYYIVSAAEMSALDGKGDVNEKDIAQRNRAAKLLEEWNMINIVDECEVDEGPGRTKLFVLPYAEAAEDKWTLESPYTIGEV